MYPFNDGNGRTARLPMNLILLRADYPPVAVRPEDRVVYLGALQEAQAGGDPAVFDRLLYERLDVTLAEQLNALTEALPEPPKKSHRAHPSPKAFMTITAALRPPSLPPKRKRCCRV